MSEEISTDEYSGPMAYEVFSDDEDHDGYDTQNMQMQVNVRQDQHSELIEHQALEVGSSPSNTSPAVTDARQLQNSHLNILNRNIDNSSSMTYNINITQPTVTPQPQSTIATGGAPPPPTTTPPPPSPLSAGAWRWPVPISASSYQVAIPRWVLTWILRLLFWLWDNVPWASFAGMIISAAVLAATLMTGFTLIRMSIQWPLGWMSTAVTGSSVMRAGQAVSLLGQIPYLGWVASWSWGLNKGVNGTAQNPQGPTEGMAETTFIRDDAEDVTDTDGLLSRVQVESPFLWGHPYAANLRRVIELAPSLSNGHSDLTVSLTSAEMVVRDTEVQAKELSHREARYIRAEEQQADLLRWKLVQSAPGRIQELLRHQDLQATRARREQSHQFETAHYRAQWRGCSDADQPAFVWWRWPCWAVKAFLGAGEQYRQIRIDAVRLETHALLSSWLNTLVKFLEDAYNRRTGWLADHGQIMGGKVDDAITGPACQISSAARKERAGLESRVTDLEVIAHNLCLERKHIKDHRAHQQSSLEVYLEWLEQAIEDARFYERELQQMKGIFFDPKARTDDFPQGTL